ncbi:tryptophanyl-trna synthetase [Ceraceosorus bombacis]|uniref:tryptophan--tRNA ligase n=1 Tax=Ceraceosorus bombacis TaxID=401625 RepID=A0A0P1BJU7_9BASI|nr:tryptophanyl-trna synthetase [Ceraceosorus bombacis]
MEPRSKRVIFSGIQPTGVPHLGNYLGALQNWVKLQDSQRAQDEMYLSIVGLHALTVPQNAARLRQEKWDMLAAILAIGIHPDKTVVFFQEDMPQHLELAWILACCTSMGKLNRMTTWKGKLAALQSASESGEASMPASDASALNLGLFSYPVLQAADILLYKATHVPVGEDQVQHLELARDLAETFNRQHANGQRYFAPPAHLITPTKRVLSLRDATQKMSKSSTDLNSRILLTDEAEAIRKKLKGAVTDSERRIAFDPHARRGVSNLLRICAALDESRDAHGWAEWVNERGGGSGVLKRVTGDVVLAKMEGVQREMKRIKGDKTYLEKVARHGAARARERAERTMREVREMIGF